MRRRKCAFANAIAACAIACSLCARYVGSASRCAYSASPMPATLPWPKIANTPANSGCAPSGVVRRAAPRDNAPAPAPSSAAPCFMRPRFARARRLPRVDQRFVVRAHPRLQRPRRRSCRRATRAPARGRSYGPTAKPRHVRLAARVAESLPPACRRRAFSPSSRTPRQCGSRSAISASMACHCAARHRRELPPLGMDAEVVEPLHRAEARRRRSARACVGGMISSRSSCPLACTASYSARICASFSRRMSIGVVGMELHEALDDVLGGPARRASCRPSGRGRTRTGLRARHLDRPPDPPAAPGRRR